MIRGHRHHQTVFEQWQRLDRCAQVTVQAGKRQINVCVKATAGLLGNTPTVCRSSYVHPAVFALYESGEMAKVLPGPETAGFEKALAKFLKTGS